MELIIENIKSYSDKKLIVDLANRLGLKVHSYDAKKEDAALAKAMKKAEKGKVFSKKDALENFSITIDVVYAEEFLKDLKKLKGTPYYAAIKALCFDQIPSLKSTSEIASLKKLKGYDDYLLQDQKRRLQDWHKDK